jgi:hypothetical protein
MVAPITIDVVAIITSFTFVFEPITTFDIAIISGVAHLAIYEGSSTASHRCRLSSIQTIIEGLDFAFCVTAITEYPIAVITFLPSNTDAIYSYWCAYRRNIEGMFALPTWFYRTNLTAAIICV